MAEKCPDCSDRLMITPAGNACCPSCNYSRKASAGEIKEKQSRGKSTQRSLSPPQETNEVASTAQDAAPSATNRVNRDSNDKSSNQRKKVTSKRIGELNKNYEKERAASQSGDGMTGPIVFFAILAIGAIVIVTNEFANDWSGGVEKESRPDFLLPSYEFPEGNLTEEEENAAAESIAINCESDYEYWFRKYRLDDDEYNKRNLDRYRLKLVEELHKYPRANFKSLEKKSKRILDRKYFGKTFD